MALSPKLRATPRAFKEKEMLLWPSPRGCRTRSAAPRRASATPGTVRAAPRGSV